MIMSALISQCRRQFGDTPYSSQAARAADGSSTLFNLGKFPIIENSHAVYFSGVAKTETADFTLDRDNGDLQTVAVQNNGVQILANFKYANWRDLNWVEAVNMGIEDLNGKGFFRQIVRDSSVFHLSADIQVYSGPTNCIDLYELLQSSDQTTSGTFMKLNGNWSYQQDQNKVVLGYKPSVLSVAKVSYLRNLLSYSATSATLDVLDGWVPLLKLKAGELYSRFMEMKIASQGSATIDEGHLSTTAWRLLANDHNQAYEQMAKRKKPTRPAKDVQWRIDGGGVA